MKLHQLLEVGHQKNPKAYPIQDLADALNRHKEHGEEVEVKDNRIAYHTDVSTYHIWIDQGHLVVHGSTDSHDMEDFAMGKPDDDAQEIVSHARKVADEEGDLGFSDDDYDEDGNYKS